MRDDAKEQLQIVNEKIRKAKTSFEEMRDLDETKSLSMEYVDQIPLGQIPEEDKEKDINEKERG